MYCMMRYIRVFMTLSDQRPLTINFHTADLDYCKEISKKKQKTINPDDFMGIMKVDMKMTIMIKPCQEEWCILLNI